VRTWRKRFAAERLAALDAHGTERARPGFQDGNVRRLKTLQCLRRRRAGTGVFEQTGNFAMAWTRKVLAAAMIAVPIAADAAANP